MSLSTLICRYGISYGPFQLANMFRHSRLLVISSDYGLMLAKLALKLQGLKLLRTPGIHIPDDAYFELHHVVDHILDSIQYKYQSYFDDEVYTRIVTRLTEAKELIDSIEYKNQTSFEHTQYQKLSRTGILLDSDNMRARYTRRGQFQSSAMLYEHIYPSSKQISRCRQLPLPQYDNMTFDYAIDYVKSRLCHGQSDTDSWSDIKRTTYQILTVDNEEWLARVFCHYYKQLRLIQVRAHYNSCNVSPVF